MQTKPGTGKRNGKLRKTIPKENPKIQTRQEGNRSQGVWNYQRDRRFCRCEHRRRAQGAWS